MLKLNQKKIIDMAGILTKIHQLRVEELADIDLPTYDFMDYFFPGVAGHEDIHHALSSLAPMARIKQERIIHGDFHAGNIVEDQGRCTVIDWTNGQLGDPRYDFAWSLLLLKIYISDRYAQVFRSAYLSENELRQEELGVFEALACLRWLLLYRNDGTPKGAKTIERAERIITSNRFLNMIALEQVLEAEK